MLNPLSQLTRALLAMPPLLGGICLALYLGTQVVFRVIVFYWLTVVGTFLDTCLGPPLSRLVWTVRAGLGSVLGPGYS
jgi:hypothetical protein